MPQRLRMALYYWRERSGTDGLLMPDPARDCDQMSGCVKQNQKFEQQAEIAFGYDAGEGSVATPEGCRAVRSRQSSLVVIRAV
jgi:hypothetical protein